MAIGRMRQRLTLQTETSVPDGAGGYALTWVDAMTVWAEIVPQSGRTLYTAGHLEGRVTHEIMVRYAAGITTDMRGLCNGRIFNIHAVINDDERKQKLRLLVEEGAPT